MSRRSQPSVHLFTSSALAFGLCVSWALPSPALAAPPEQPAAAPAPAPSDGAVAPSPQPAATQPVQPQPVPAPVYQPPAPQPVPPAPPNRNRGLGLVIAGSSLFGFAYLISAVSGTIMMDTNKAEIGRPLLIPVAGPFIAATRSQTAIGSFGLAFAGIIQIAGFGMGVGGAVVLAKSRRQARLSVTPGGLQLRF